MSLVPPVHIVLLDASKIYNTFFEAQQAEGWANGLPTNSLLISGPSKTADIQQTLAYGAHGPKELVVLIKPTIIRSAQDWEAQTQRSRAALDDIDPSRRRVIRVDGATQDAPAGKR